MKQTKWIKRVDGHKQRYHCSNYGYSPLSDLSQRMFGRPPHMLSEWEYTLLMNRFEGKHQAGAMAHKKVNFGAFLTGGKKGEGDKEKVKATITELKQKQQTDTHPELAAGEEIGYKTLLEDLGLSSPMFDNITVPDNTPKPSVSETRAQFEKLETNKLRDMVRDLSLDKIKLSTQEQIELGDVFDKRKLKEKADAIAMRTKPGKWRDDIPRPDDWFPQGSTHWSEKKKKDDEPQNFGMAAFGIRGAESPEENTKQANLEKARVKERLEELQSNLNKHPGDLLTIGKKKGYERALNELHLKKKLDKELVEPSNTLKEEKINADIAFYGDDD